MRQSTVLGASAGLLIVGVACLWIWLPTAPDQAKEPRSRQALSPSGPDGRPERSPRLTTPDAVDEAGSESDVAASPSRGTQAQSAEEIEAERRRRATETRDADDLERRRREALERDPYDEEVGGESQVGVTEGGAAQESLDEIVTLLSAESWVSEPSDVRAAVETMNMLYEESKERGNLEGDIEGHKHAIDRVLDAATIMLLEGDLEGATLLAEAREALAENRIDEAEQLVRDAVNAYQ